MSNVKYDTLKKLVNGNFKVKCSERSREQNNAVTQFHRARGKFEIRKGKLLYNSTEVMRTSDVKNVIRTQFDKSHGCGARTLSQTLRRRYHGITEA